MNDPLVQQTADAATSNAPWWVASALAILATGTTSAIAIIRALRLRTSGDKRLDALERALGITVAKDGTAHSTVLDGIATEIARLREKRTTSPPSTRAVGTLREQLDTHEEQIAEHGSTLEQVVADVQALGQRQAEIDGRLGGKLDMLANLVHRLVEPKGRATR